MTKILESDENNMKALTSNSNLHRSDPFQIKNWIFFKSFLKGIPLGLWRKNFLHQDHTTSTRLCNKTFTNKSQENTAIQCTYLHLYCTLQTRLAFLGAKCSSDIYFFFYNKAAGLWHKKTKTKRPNNTPESQVDSHRKVRLHKQVS